MNRAQKRREQKGLRRKNNILKMPNVEETRKEAVPEQADFSAIPLATVCQSIQLLINELKNRGIPVYDFDHKDKVLQQIQILHGKVFFLAAKEVTGDEKV